MKAKVLSLFFLWYNKLLWLKNSKKARLLVYTDSRGFNVNSKLGKTPFDSYVRMLAERYRVTYFICPEKFTTIIDFLEAVKTLDLNNYDCIILHCGVVDFSPRPLSNINKVFASKAGKPVFEKLKKCNNEYYANPFPVTYYNENTITLYSKEYLEKEIIPQLLSLKNLVWINSNHFVPGWEGNFTKGRPENIEDLVDSFDQLMMKYIPTVIDLKNWTDKMIQEYTIDNIHFTPSGFRELYRLLSGTINKQILK